MPGKGYKRMQNKSKEKEIETQDSVSEDGGESVVDQKSDQDEMKKDNGFAKGSAYEQEAPEGNDEEAKDENSGYAASKPVILTGMCHVFV